MGKVSNEAIFSSAFSFYKVNPDFYQKVKYFLTLWVTISAIVYKYMSLIHAIMFFFFMIISLPYFIPSYKVVSIDAAQKAPSNMRPVTKDLHSDQAEQYFEESIKYLERVNRVSFFSLARKERTFSCQIKCYPVEDDRHIIKEWAFYDMEKKSIPEMNLLMAEWINIKCLSCIYLKKMNEAAAYDGKSYLIDVIVFMLDCFEKMEKMPLLSTIIAEPYIHEFPDGRGIVWDPCKEGSHKCHIMNDDVVEWVKEHTLSKFMDLFRQEKNETKQIIVDYIRKYGFHIIGDFLANDYDDEVLALILLDIMDQYNEEGEFDCTIEQIKTIISI